MPKSSVILIILLLLIAIFLFLLNKDLLSKKSKEESYSKIPIEPLLKRNYSFVVNEVSGREESLSKYAFEEFQAGMNVLVYGQPNMDEVTETFTRLRSLGFNSISINFPFYQADWQASEVETDPQHTPTTTELKGLIEAAHKKGFSVMIRPIMDEQVFLSSNRWRGRIKPNHPEEWFNSYEKLILKYALLAQEMNVKILNIGTELNSMENEYGLRWRQLIENVREIYDGKLIYSFNWDRVLDVQYIDFVENLDYIGIDAYFPLHVEDGASVAMLEEAWQQTINQFLDQLPNKPIIVTEAGMIPIEGAYRTPYAWQLHGRKKDLKAQAHYYEATYKEWQPISKGIYWWTVTLEDNMNEVSFSPLYSPTEQVIKKQNLKNEKDLEQ